MRVTVDEPGDGAEATAVELLDVRPERRELAHAPHALDLAVPAQDEGVLVDVDGAELGSAGTPQLWEPTQGPHTLTLVDAGARELDRVTVDVRGRAPK
jgi:hypothetical protein